MQFKGTYYPQRDPTLRYEYDVSVARGKVATWSATLRCNGELQWPITGIVDPAPEDEVSLQDAIERWVRDSIERRVGVD